MPETLRFHDGQAYIEASNEEPYPVKLMPNAGPLHVGGTVRIGPFGPTDIVTGAAYADLDAMGVTPFLVSGGPHAVPRSGVIQSAIYIDRDDEGLQIDLWLFTAQVGNQTDNSAFVVSDADLTRVIDVIQFSSFRDANTGQVSVVNGIGTAYELQPGENMYGLLQARGALNIAAGALPLFNIKILGD